jgi:dTDP-4-dehydrorhamnose 3,5-epimerase
VIFTETKLPGAFLIEPEKLRDDRGFFARTFCRMEFEERGLDPIVMQCNISFNSRAGTLRGMHYQVPPFEEAKLVRCTTGAIYDVIIDLRPASPSFKEHEAFELSAESCNMLYIPKGFAHGFQTLEKNTEVFYQMSQVYNRDHARGVRWNDPAFGIAWPPAERIMFERDRHYPDFKECLGNGKHRS